MSTTPPANGNNDPDLLELYKIAVETRQFEIQMFWQRTNYFLIFETALVLSFYTKTIRVDEWILPLMGYVVSALWFRMVMGSKFWQMRWEEAAAEREEEYAPNAKMFAATPKEHQDKVKHHLGKSTADSSGRYFDEMILQKPSPSGMMLALAGSFMAFWLVVLIWVFANPIIRK